MAGYSGEQVVERVDMSVLVEVRKFAVEQAVNLGGFGFDATVADVVGKASAIEAYVMRGEAPAAD